MPGSNPFVPIECKTCPMPSLTVLRAIVLVASVTLSAHAYAADAATSAPTGSHATEIAVLKAQLETTRQFQDSFMSMGLWTLTGVITAALALGVFGWYTSKTNYERDREALQREAKALREATESALKDGIQRAAKTLEDALVARQTAIQQAVEKVVQAKINGLLATIGSLADEVFELKSAALEAEADAAVVKKNFGSAVRQYGQLLGLQTKAGFDEYEAADILDKLRSVVKVSGTKLDAETVNNVVETLLRLPTRHHAASEPLIKDLKRCLQ
jgi:flavin-binding protein dodecin